MANPTIINPILSMFEVLQAREPKSLLEQRLISLLTKRLKELKIIWSPKAFRGGLNTPELSENILKKLEALVLLAEAVNWKISKALRDELDSTVEDIETFNPAFIERMKKSSQDIKAGKFITLEELEKKLGLARPR